MKPVCGIDLFSNNVMRFKADNVDPILNSASCYGIHADFSAWPVRNLIRGNVEHGRFLCNYSFITALVRRQENQHALRSCWSSSPLPGHRMCTSDRQSNMTAIYTHWVRWKLLALSLRPRSPKRMGEEADKAGKRPVNFYILGCLGCFPVAGAPTCTHTHGSCTDECERVQSCSRDTDTHTPLLILRCGPLMFKVLYLLCASVLSYHFQHCE